MMMSSLTIYIVIFAVLSSSIIAFDPCRFEDPVKGVIDLVSVGHSDGTAVFRNKSVIGSNYRYYYNPCKPFTIGPVCIDVAVCQVSSDGEYNFILGHQNSTVWNPGFGLGSKPSVTYSYGEKNVTVSLLCSRKITGELEALGEDPENNYRFRLTHRCACWDGCNDSPPTTTTPVTGAGNVINGKAVFILTLLIFAFVYSSGFVTF